MQEAISHIVTRPKILDSELSVLKLLRCKRGYGHCEVGTKVIEQACEICALFNVRLDARTPAEKMMLLLHKNSGLSSAWVY